MQIEEPLFNLLISTPDISFWHSAPFGDLALNEVLGYMLSWLLLFEHFQDIVRLLHVLMGYILLIRDIDF